MSDFRGAGQHSNKSYELPDGQVITMGKVCGDVVDLDRVLSAVVLLVLL